MRYAQIAYFHAFGTFNFLFRDSDTKLKIHCFSQLVLITKKTFQFFEVIPEVPQNNEWMYDTTNRGSIGLPLLHSEYDTERALEATKNKEVETVKLDKAWNVQHDMVANRSKDVYYHANIAPLLQLSVAQSEGFEDDD